jgi:hypothetical protein
MSSPQPLRSWSSLSEAERTALLADYQPVLDTQPLTCSFEGKLARMQAWLAERGVSISEDEIRRPGRPGS